ncbi:MAG: FAD-dependent cmnm(5)s(2)U34 oxidoreductase, partial [Rhodoferax sp.]
SATRCVAHDRLPLLGPLDVSDAGSPWLCAAMGSRGLSFAPLCAELLAARLHGVPWPVPSSLARSLDPQRKRR